MSKTRKASLTVIFCTVFIDLLGFGIVLPLLPRYGQHFQASHLQLGLLMASFSAMQFLFAPLWGRISDRVGRRPILILGLVGSTISYALFGYATSLGADGQVWGLSALTWLFITRIGAGVSGATIPTAQAYIADITGVQERGKGMALIGAAFGIGFTFGPLIGAAFVSTEVSGAPSAMPGYVASVLSGLALISAIFVLPESLNEKSKASESHWLDFSSLKTALSRPALGLILGIMFLVTLAFAKFETTLALLTKELGMGERDNFFVFAYIGLVLTLSQGMLVRRLMPRLGEFRMAMLGAPLMVVGLLLVSLVAELQSRTLLFAVLPIITIGFSALTPSLQSLLSLRALENEQGGVLGLGQSISALARILGHVAGMVLLGVGSSTPYWVGAGLMALAVIMIVALRSQNPADAQHMEQSAASAS